VTHGLFPQSAAPRVFLATRSFEELRHGSSLRWLGDRRTYAVGVLIVTGLSVATSMLAPRFLGPAAFGTFTLLTSLFQYATKTDLGLSQLADRKLAVAGAEADGAANILRSRLTVGSAVLGVAIPVAMLIAWMTGKLPAPGAALAIAAGGAFMIANGPVTVFRAESKVWEFTAAALLLNIGLTAPRLAGLVFGGVTGCFIALALWYGALAALLSRSIPMTTKAAPTLSMVRLALPLFAFNALWELYLSGNRWISAGLSSPEDFGLFAFGANLALTGIGMLATIAQVRYPKILAQIGKHPPGAGSRLVEREALFLCLLLSVGAAMAIIATGPMIHLVFPRFERAAPVTMALAISCVPLGVVAAIIPLVISLSPRPWAHAIALFAPAFILLLGGMAAGNRMGGIAGQGWACTAAGLALIIGVAALMRRIGILGAPAAVRVVFFQAVVIAALAWLAAARAPAAAETMSPPGWKLTFSDDFANLRLWDETAGGVWEPLFLNGDHTHEKELQYYLDPRPARDPVALSGRAPFRFDERGLIIRANKIPIAERKYAKGLPYASGLLTTFRSFSFTYGYVEMRARVPRGKGLWPAFWLLPVDQTWPPEIDVMEVLGGDTNAFHATVHSRARGEHTAVSSTVATPDLSDDFHVYAVRWTAEELDWYFDGRLVASAPTPADMHKPMYLLVNLAVGGWAQMPDAATEFPAEFRINWIQVFQAPQRGAAAQ
jgi:O-antigen/teichoic acid export membrane protein